MVSNLAGLGLAAGVTKTVSPGGVTRMKTNHVPPRLCLILVALCAEFATPQVAPCAIEAIAGVVQ